MLDVGEVILEGNYTRYSLISNVIPGGTFYVMYTCLGSDFNIRCSCRKMECDGLPVFTRSQAGTYPQHRLEVTEVVTTFRGLVAQPH